MSHNNEENSSSSNNSNHQLKSLKYLYDAGVLTQVEYMQKLDKVINELPSKYQQGQENINHIIGTVNEDNEKHDGARNILDMDDEMESATHSKSNFFSAHGRLNRIRYFIYYYVVNALILVYAGLFTETETFAYVAIITICVAFIYYNSCVQIIKRLHDLGRPGTHLFMLLIPVYNVYLSLILLFISGDSGTNKYGENPLRPKNNLIEI